MCLAIGPSYTPQRGRLGRLWWRIAGSPLHLLGAGAALHAAALGLPLAAGAFARASAPVWLMAGLGVSALLLFGYLLDALPAWTGRSSVHYLRYSSTWLAFNVGLLLLELAVFTGADVAVAGGLALTVGALLALQGIRQYWPWIRPRYRARATAAVITACLLGCGIITVAVAA